MAVGEFAIIICNPPEAAAAAFAVSECGEGCTREMQRGNLGSWYKCQEEGAAKLSCRLGGGGHKVLLLG